MRMFGIYCDHLSTAKLTPVDKFFYPTIVELSITITSPLLGYLLIAISSSFLGSNSTPVAIANVSTSMFLGNYTEVVLESSHQNFV